ncbi:hypothetical protein MNBD_GAMMA22-2242 [hydrothermal vent metagenome]|uniref:Plastocyanin-like domain-containing protein n=1 Tax=hydrothermal vent metagenome TaxID=652676 RepID=A0A3B1ACG7_9ZZZZ
MKFNKLKTKSMLKQGLMLSALLASATQANAAVQNLCTGVVTKLMPDGVQVSMWGFGIDDASATCSTATVPGPEITVPVGDTALTINLRNTLPDSVSVTIPGLTTPSAVVPVRSANGRVRSFTHETVVGATGVYNFVVKPGTFLYQTGTHIAKQIQMGLYGATIQENSAAIPATATTAAVPATAYPGVSFDRSITMLYSEIDPTLHQAVADATYGTPAYSSTINFKPKYFLVNGEAYTLGVAATATTPLIPATAKIYGGLPGSNILFRFLNAGLESHVPMINGHHVSIVAEYGNQYPYVRSQYSVLLAAGQTRDAVMTSATVAGDFSVFDRRIRLSNSAQAGIGGMYSVIAIADVNPNAFTTQGTTGSGTAGVSNPSTGGGCTIQSAARFDPLMPLLLLLSLVYFIRRARVK